MGTKLHCENYFPGCFSMRDVNEDSNSCGWPLYHGDKNFATGQYCNGFLPRTIADAYLNYDKDVVKQIMLEHEAIFKNQVYELHRLYRIQTDLMDEVKRKELPRNQIPIDTSLSSSPLASQITSEDARKWHISAFPLVNSVSTRPSTSRVEEIRSPFSSIKESSAHASPLPSQNGGTSRNVEVLELRPTKVRRKMLDLQLPAEEYIYTEEGEQFVDENFSGASSCLPNRNNKITSENGTNLYVGNGKKSNCRGDSSQSGSCLRRRPNVADLNEPIEIEDTDAPGYVDLVGHDSLRLEVDGHELAAKSKSQLLGFPENVSLNSRYSSDNRSLNNPHMQNNANGRQWLPNILDRGHNKNNLMSAGLHPEKMLSSSQSAQVLFNTIHEPPGLFPSNQSNVDHLREKKGHRLLHSERYHGMCNDNHRESLVGSHRPSPYPIASSNPVESWSNSLSSWEKPSSSLSQKSISAQMHPYLNPSTTMSRSSQSSTQRHSIFGDRRNYNSTSVCTSSFGNEMPIQNGFYHGSSSGSKESLVHIPSSHYDHPNCSSANHAALEQFANHGSAKSCRSLNHTNLTSRKDVNLNVVFSSISSDKVDHQQNQEVIDLERKNEDHLATLPWLRSKPAPKNEVTDARLDLNTGKLSFLQPPSNQFSRTESEKGTDHAISPNVKSVSCSNVIEPSKFEGSESSSCKKILGIPIHEKPHISKNESSSFTSPSVSLPQPSGGVENSQKHMMFDINLPCDAVLTDFGQQTAAEAMSIVKETDVKVANLRHQIDLNSSMSEDEASLVPSFAESNVKTNAGIDLEAPLVPETNEDVTPGEECLEQVHETLQQFHPGKAEIPEDEHIRIAAEAIVAISLAADHAILNDSTVYTSKASMTDPLQWFAEIISSSREDRESRVDAVLRAKDVENNEQTFGKELDYFESMTLKLAETKEEDYMPKPLVPENLKLEETMTTPLPTRTRKGQARRGRHRRDFQRDILPGLASLSRHEVTEDLQTFGGLMRATGHSWLSGLTRRNSTRSGTARGRRRVLVSPPPPIVVSPPCTPLIQHLNNIEVRLEDRSLTGWGKTTRRPRRQRCPAGNPPPVPLT